MTALMDSVKLKFGGRPCVMYVDEIESKQKLVDAGHKDGDYVDNCQTKHSSRSPGCLGIALFTVALMLAFGSLILCLDIRAMLIKQADQVHDIKVIVQDIYGISSTFQQSLDASLDSGAERNDDLVHDDVDDNFGYFLRDSSKAADGIESAPDGLDLNLEVSSDDDEEDDDDEDRAAADYLRDEQREKASELRNDGEKLAQQCDFIPDSWKFDCHPESNASEERCMRRGCCWQLSSKAPWLPKGSDGVPACFYPTDYASYSFDNITRTDTGYQLFLSRATKSYFPEDVALLKMDVVFETQHRLHVKFTDALNKRYEVPVPVMPSITKEAAETDYDVSFHYPFGFQVQRKSTGEILFDSSLGAFIFANQFLQISAQLPSTYIYGLGEQRDSFVRSFDWRKIVLMNSDHVPQENTNLYASHPFYLMMEGSNQSHGVLLFNSNPIEIVLQPLPAITYRALGGVLDFYFFLGPSPSEVVSQYTELIGRPFMPPYWSLGFHLCRLGYDSADNVREIWQRTRDTGIPFDTQWTDIDYMLKRRDFSINRQKFGNLQSLVEDIHAADMHYVPIVDCAIGTSSTPGDYQPYDDGVKMDIFIKDDKGKILVGKVWPGESVWPDFTNPNATMYWTAQFENFHAEVPYDGAWIDMNEPSNFISGCLNGCPESSWDDPPYTPSVTGGKLAYLTICMSAQQSASRHYDVHNIYGLTEAIATNFALTTVRPNKRPFVISRSSFPGTGHYAGVWTGDVSSAWHDMGRSVADILNFNLFGIPLVGADICGFNGNTTVKLCQRWMELGAFYPFARNHNEDSTIAQDPVALGPDVVVSSLKAFYLRYRLLPYLYTLFRHAYDFGQTVARPLFFEFPNDRRTYTIDTQFLWGTGLMVLPVLQEDVVTITPYFPRGIWYLLPSNVTVNSSGSEYAVDAPLDTIVVALRGGSIIPIQGVNMTTTASRYEMFGLWVALCNEGKGRGEIYWDDGDSLDVLENGIFNRIYFQAENNTIVSTVKQFNYHGENSMTLGDILVFGVQSAPTSLSVNSTDHPFSYEVDTKILQIEQLQIRLEYPFTIAWK